MPLCFYALVRLAGGSFNPLKVRLLGDVRTDSSTKHVFGLLNASFPGLVSMKEL